MINIISQATAEINNPFPSCRITAGRNFYIRKVDFVSKK